MKQDMIYPNYTTAQQTVGTNFDVDPLDNRMRIRNYHENLIQTYAEMNMNDLYRMKVYTEILAVADYLKRTSWESVNENKMTNQ